VDFPEHILRYRNHTWAEKTGLGSLTTEEWVDHFGRFEPLEGSFDRPLSLRYHGHQFRTYNPELGDGRGFLYAQLYDDAGRLLDLGTKGSGQTPWSRGGDGRLTLKGGVREVIAPQLLAASGVDTSKPFSLVETGESLHRGDEPSPTRSAVLVRLNHSHIRIGTFQRLSHLKDAEAIERLVMHCIAHYYPELKGADNPAVALLGAVAEKVAATGARWVAAGFVHGVLNTDNINITGESFDYGPWRFLPHYDPGFTAAYFDQTGLYAFGRQPDALAWNLTRLAECLLPMAEREVLEEALNRFWPAFRSELATAYLDRLGLQSNGEAKDMEMLGLLMRFMGETQAPYEQVLFDWRGGMLSGERAAAGPIASLYEGEAFAPLRQALADFGPVGDANLGYSYFARSTPRTMLIDELEAIWAPIAEEDDWSLFTATLAEIDEMAEAYGNG
jgi:uncharacterized protein YdiU (UPF0061 family)